VQRADRHSVKYAWPTVPGPLNTKNVIFYVSRDLIDCVQIFM